MQNILLQGLDLMVIGMGMVFVFLTLLVVSTSLMSKIVVALESREPPLSTRGIAASTQFSDQELIAVITAAIRQHRAKKQ